MAVLIRLTTGTALLLGPLYWLILGLDDWLGWLAFTPQYVIFTALVAGGVAAFWLVKSKHFAVAAGLATLALLLFPYVLSEPSARILRGVLLDVPAGSSVEVVEARVEEAYRGSGYRMPKITRRERRLDVSLMTQAQGDCTAVHFHLEDGRVTHGVYSAD